MAEVTKTITHTSAKKHYLMTGLSCVGSCTNTDNYNRQFQYQFSTDSGLGYEIRTSTVNANASKAVSETITDSSGQNRLKSATALTLWTDLSSASISTAAIQYGAKAVPDISSSFKGGYMRPDLAKAITFTSNKVNNIYEQYTISSGVFYYKLSSAGAYSSISFSGSSVTIPANTLTTGNTYNAYADITVDDGTVVTVTMNDISTVDAAPTVTALAPINTVVYGETTFRWSYSISTGTDQLAFDLQISSDGVTYTTLANHVQQSETSYDATLNTSGTLYWQVRGYNQDDIASSWSTAATFINNIPPSAPVITSVTTTGRPTVSWSSNDQIAFQVQVLNGYQIIEDSEAVYSPEKEYQTQEYLPDGTYTIRVRIFNIYGKSSDWATALYTQSAQLTPPVFTLYGSDAGITIVIEEDASYDIYYIKRNGVTIGSTDTGVYVDRFGNGANTYTVIGVTSAGNSAQSSETYTYIVSSNMLIDQDGTVYLVNHRLGSPVGVQLQLTAQYDQANYIGASLPEFHFAKLRSGRFTVVFKDYVDIEKMLGRVMFYADMYGNGAWVALTSVGRTESRFGNETTAELQLTSYDEAVQYA